MTGDLAKLRQCLLMLSGEHDGEVVAAARAINRVLATSGRDWHWLAGKLTDSGAEKAERRSGSDDAGGDLYEDHRDAAGWLIERHWRRLRPKDLDFLATMQDWRGQPTEKQAAWLADLCRRFGYAP
ncbi:hypothetical protein [Mesorhizobium sp. M0244]|uniref:hypothetical protein n=1 Tax=Mesorhizobium sp. M0244 TaxID=2956926 RepID=UPI003338098F